MVYIYIEGVDNPKRPRSANNDLPHDKKKDVFKNTPRPYHDSFTYSDLFDWGPCRCAVQ